MDLNIQERIYTNNYIIIAVIALIYSILLFYLKV